MMNNHKYHIVLKFAIFILIEIIIVIIVNLYTSRIVDYLEVRVPFLFFQISTINFVVLILIAFAYGFLCLLNVDNIISYNYRLYKSFYICGPLLQHYAIYTPCLIFLSVLLFNNEYYQSLFLFSGDYAVILMFLSMVSVLIIHFKKNIIDHGNESHIDDLEYPIDSIQDDQIGFGETVGKIHTRIFTIKNNFKAISFLVLGEWGDGKTSFLNLLRIKLLEAGSNEHSEDKDRDNNKKENIRVIYFDVSKYENSNLIYIHFYNCILKELSKEFILPAFIRFNLINRMLSNIGNKNYVFSLLLIYLSTKTIEDDLMKLSYWLIKSNTKLVIQIDEMDRLVTHETHAVFKLIRLVKANMKNIVLIVATTKNCLNNHYNNYSY